MVYYTYNKHNNVVSLDSMLFIIKKSYNNYYNYLIFIIILSIYFNEENIDKNFESLNLYIKL